MISQHQDQWEFYTTAWKVKTEAEKHALFEKCLATDCVYHDPHAVTESWDALASYMLEFHKMVPGGHFVTREFNSHNNRSIAEWDMCAGDGTVVGVGISYGEYNEAGQLTSMSSFFDPPEAD